MEFFVRYFVELDLPQAAVETALNGVAAQWLADTANEAHARALGFLLEADPQLGSDLAGSIADVRMHPAIRRGSTSIRSMAWALMGPSSARPLLEADLELGSLGHNRCQLAVAGRYYPPGNRTGRRIDRGAAQRVGEATIKQFVDGLAKMIEKLAFEVPGVPPPQKVLRRLAPDRGLTGA